MDAMGLVSLRSWRFYIIFVNSPALENEEECCQLCIHRNLAVSVRGHRYCKKVAKEGSLGHRIGKRNFFANQLLFNSAGESQSQ